MESPLRLGNSKISGTGVFATKVISTGEFICLMNGKEVSLKEVGELEIIGTQREGDALQIDVDSYLIIEEIYRCVNHSCSPNAFIRGKNELIALRSIANGEEITFDYSTTMWEDATQIKKLFNEDIWTMNCSCKSDECRKEIKQFYELPEKIQEKYLRLNAVPDFILKLKGLSQCLEVIHQKAKFQ